MIKQVKHFNRIVIPKSIEPLIQECAIKHLGVRDIGKLRDKYEGQRYFDILRKDIISEFAFEKYLNLGKFDWKKRIAKNYLRRIYTFNDESIELINFTINSYPRFDPSKIKNTVFVYIKPDYRVYISGLATKQLILKKSVPPLEYNPLNRELQEIREFDTFIPFSSVKQLSARVSQT